MARSKQPKAIAVPQPFAVRRSSIQGRGCFATRDIRKGERIAEYLGERISWKEADRRYDDDGMRRHHTFLFAVTTRTVIDGAVDGNDSRFINHACDPNCEAVDDEGRIFVEALRPIAAGEELFYDYAYARDETTSEEDEALYVCRCGSPKCRGSILEPPKKAARLPRTHHVAARHPHEHLAAGDAGAKSATPPSRRTASDGTTARKKAVKGTTPTKSTSRAKTKSPASVKSTSHAKRAPKSETKSTKTTPKSVAESSAKRGGRRTVSAR